MGLWEKIKLLFKIKGPAGDAVDAFKDAKKTKKWFHFAVTIIGVLATTVLALNGIIPPELQNIISSFLQALYNFIRGADKASDDEIKGTFRTTEFWLSGITEFQKAVVASKTGNVTPHWVALFGTILDMGALALGQNLSSRAPNPDEPGMVDK